MISIAIATYWRTYILRCFFFEREFPGAVWPYNSIKGSPPMHDVYCAYTLIDCRCIPLDKMLYMTHIHVYLPSKYIIHVVFTFLHVLCRIQYHCVLWLLIDSSCVCLHSLYSSFQWNQIFIVTCTCTLTCMLHVHSKLSAGAWCLHACLCMYILLICH